MRPPRTEHRRPARRPLGRPDLSPAAQRRTGWRAGARAPIRAGHASATHPNTGVPRGPPRFAAGSDIRYRIWPVRRSAPEVAVSTAAVPAVAVPVCAAGRRAGSVRLPAAGRRTGPDAPETPRPCFSGGGGAAASVFPAILFSRKRRTCASVTNPSSRRKRAVSHSARAVQRPADRAVADRTAVAQPAAEARSAGRRLRAPPRPGPFRGLATLHEHSRPVSRP